MKTNGPVCCRVVMGCALGLGVAMYLTAGRRGPAPVQAGSAPVGGADRLVLQAVVRDFRSHDVKGGHADFESYGNTCVRVGLLADALESDEKPVFGGAPGQDVTVSFTDSAGRIINPAFFDASQSDVAGTLRPASTPMITSPAGFDQWYRDVPGTNVSKVVEITLVGVAGTGQYVFDSATDEPYRSLGGFFPIDGELFGNYAATGHNFHFTTEIHTTFTCQKGQGQVFKFTGDDDVWVFIDGRLVIDLGGLHPKREQHVELDRLTWLRDGASYPLAVFHAERHTTQSNFRIETNLQLCPVQPPATSGLYD